MNRIAYITGYMDKKSYLRKTIEQEGLVLDKKDEDEEEYETAEGTVEVPEMHDDEWPQHGQV